MKKLLLLSFLGLAQISAAQITIDVLSYNVLNFPNGSASRIDTLKKILTHYTPDLMLVQELKSDVGLASITTALNEISPDPYSSGTYEVQQSNPSSSWKLQQNIIYNTDMFSLAEEKVITSTYRDINYFKLYLNDVNLSTSLDTIFLHVYVTHLKSSQGATNEQLRFEMSQVMRAEINALPANSNVLCGGDFNVYNSSEAAYQHLLTTGPNKEIHTQSTRLTALSDGASGGLDDRFDFVLHSTELNQGNSRLDYIDGTYDALGNNGTCYNQDLLNCTSIGNVPDSIISALYYFSDHLPVVFSLSSDATLSAAVQALNDFQIYPNPVENLLYLITNSNQPIRLIITDISGKVVVDTTFTNKYAYDLTSINPGIYLVNLLDGNVLVKREKVFKL
jgi:endonuclease/exonuclease/phosphatase family metal-dependent hydrolase